MLSEIRDRATGWIAYIIVGLIVIPFAFWGVNEYFSGGEQVVVATVGDTEIQQLEYRQALENRRSQLRRMLGDNFDPALVNSPEFKRGVVEELVAQALLEQHAAQEGYRVSDEQLARNIRSIPRFQVGDEFSPDAYASAVTRMGMTQAAFEARMRQQLMLQQLRSGVSDSAFVTRVQEDRLLELLLQQRRFDLAVLDAGRFVDEVEVSEDEVRQTYDSDSERYRTPERLKVEYVELSVDEIAPSINVTQEEIQQAYKQNRDRYTTEPVRHASHILVEVGDDATEQEREKALEKARMLREKLRNGADFAELAREYSDDPGSASDGGDLGRIERGNMVAPFEKALFKLDKVGEVTDPVKTRFGYHLIKLTEYQPAKVKPFADVRDELRQEVRTDQAESLFLDRAETFRNVSYEQPQSLEPVADQLDLRIRQGDWFTRDQGAGIADNPAIREAAFSEEVHDDGLNSKAIEMDVDTLVVVRLLDRKASSIKPLTEVRDDIVTQLKRRKSRERVAQLGPQIVAQLESGGKWQSLVDEYAMSSEVLSWSHDRTRQPDDPQPAIINAVYRLPEPTEEASASGGLVLDNGDFALVNLREVVDGSAAKAPEELRQQVSDALLRRRGQDMLAQYIDDLRERTEVTVRQEAL